MAKKQLISAFITLPVAEAQKGKEISGVRAFARNVMETKVKSLNGQAKNYNVVELEVPKDECIIGTTCVTIPITSKAIIKNCYSIEEFSKEYKE